jgi:hypothetical protein
MSEYERVAMLYPRISLKDFEFLEISRQWMAVNQDDEAIRDYFRRAAREASITPGLISMIRAGHPPKKLLMYPYDKFPEMLHINVSQRTLFKLNKVVKLIQWQPKMDKHGLQLEQINKNSRAKHLLYNIAMNDDAVQLQLKKLDTNIPITQTRALHISLYPPEMKLTDLPDSFVETFDQGIEITVAGVSIGFSLDCPKFSWFLCIEVDIQKTIDYINLALDINCQATSHITIATKPR